MGFFSNLESDAAQCVDHLKQLLSHDDVIPHLISGFESFDDFLEKPVVKAVVETTLPLSVAGYKYLDALNAVSAAVKSKSVPQIAASIAGAAQAAGEIAPVSAQGVIAEVGKAAEVVTEVASAATPDAASSAVEAAKRFAAVSGTGDIQLTHPDPLEGMPGSSN